MSSKDVQRLGRIVSALTEALADFDALARPIKANRAVLAYLLRQAREEAGTAWATEYVDVYGALPDRKKP